MTIVTAAFTQDLILISSRGVLQDLGLQRSAAEVQLWQCCFPLQKSVRYIPED